MPTNCCGRYRIVTAPNASPPLGDFRRQAEGVAGGIEEHQMVLGIRLHVRPHGAEGKRPSLRVGEVLDVEVEVDLLGH